MKTMLWMVAALGVTTFGAATAWGQETGDWPRFRGPRGDARIQGEPPTEWAADRNVAWKAEMPGPGSSSPIVVGNRVFTTCYSGYGLSAEQPGDQAKLTRHLLCHGLSDGKLLWKKDVPADPGETDFGDFLTQHGYATTTPVCDGEQVYVVFGLSGVFAFDLDGNQKWNTTIGAGVHYWGTGGSPIVVGDLVVVNATIESKSLVALRRADGKEAWRLKGLNNAWSTPTVVDLPDGRRELSASFGGKLLGVDPLTGAERWHVATKQSYAAPSPVLHDGRLYLFSAQPDALLCVRPGGQGDVGETHVDWRLEGFSASITTPVVVDGLLYAVDRSGILSCAQLDPPKLLYRKRLGGEFYASPTASSSHLYCPSRLDGLFVVALGPEYRLASHNRLSPDDSLSNSTPALLSDSLIHRTNTTLYRLQRP